MKNKFINIKTYVERIVVILLISILSLNFISKISFAEDNFDRANRM